MLLKPEFTGFLATAMTTMSDRSTTSTGEPCIRLQITAANLCHPDKTGCDGEDAYGVREYSDRQIFAVADGVSGSRAFGDPAEFSRALLRFTFGNLELGMPILSAIANALHDIRAKGKRGSTTLLLGVLEENQAGHSRSLAKLYNLGDSKAMLFRAPGRTAPYEFFTQTHLQCEERRLFHGTPYQFHHCGDRSRGVADMAVYEWALIPGDVVVAATDGLYDFLEVEAIVSAIEEYRHDFGQLAAHLTKQARMAQRLAHHFDDITVIVAVADNSGRRLSTGLTVDNFGAVC